VGGKNRDESNQGAIGFQENRNSNSYERQLMPESIVAMVLWVHNAATQSGVEGVTVFRFG
jgi:hypothetical protein